MHLNASNHDVNNGSSFNLLYLNHDYKIYGFQPLNKIDAKYLFFFNMQGSPLFNFLCTLSPIKPVKSVHVAQSFSEISFPPPPSVFVSPRADLRKDFRSHEGYAKLFPPHICFISNFIQGNSSILGIFLFLPQKSLSLCYFVKCPNRGKGMN